MFKANTLRDNIGYWETISDNTTVLHWIREGVKLPFSTKPDNFYFNNRQFTALEAEFIDKEVSRLQKSGCIVQCRNPRFVSPINVVPKKQGFRLVSDLRHLNKHISPPSFVYESIEDVLKITNVNEHMVTWDLEQGFHHIPIHPEYSDYLCFKWKNAFYKWTVTPFGGNFSPYYFCKTVREVVKHLRQNDLKTVSYVDDFYLCDDASLIEGKIEYARQELGKLGWHINLKKSCFTPKTECKFIGFLVQTGVDDKAVWLKVPKNRIDKVKKDIKRILKKDQVTARALARIAGQIVSMTKAVTPAKLLLRNLYQCLRSRTSWQDLLTLDIESIKDLRWWLKAFEAWNGRAFRHQSISIEIATDASAEGWGATMLSSGLKAQGYWTTAQSYKSSNFRETLAVLLSLLAFLSQVKGKSVTILSDNVSAVSYINMQGGPAMELSRIARAMWSLALKHNIQLKAQHLKGVLNVQADTLSRLSSQYEWCLHQKVYDYLNVLWGPHTIDRFATMATTKCIKYNSRFLDPASMGVDALLQEDWGQENNYVNPPIRLLDQVLDIICQQQATATVIAPEWKAQWFYQRLKQLSVAPPIKLPKAKLFCTQMGIQTPEPLKNHKWTWFAWRISGKGNC